MEKRITLFSFLFILLLKNMLLNIIREEKRREKHT